MEWGSETRQDPGGLFDCPFVPITLVVASAVPCHDISSVEDEIRTQGIYLRYKGFKDALCAWCLAGFTCACTDLVVVVCNEDEVGGHKRL
jgi:hypothetical protein